MNNSASLYIHIPFCQRACHYCSFYFVLSHSRMGDFLTALKKEIIAKKKQWKGYSIETIYFGGGTPSMLSPNDLEDILKTIYPHYSIASDVEISIESNPENLNSEYIASLQAIGFNRLSIGVQSFFDADLQSMNRSHSRSQAIQAIETAKKYVDNISIDLMFGLPYSGVDHWKENLQLATDMGIPHISTYNLTVEEKTYLARKVARKEIAIEPDDTLNEMYLYTYHYLVSKGFLPYEISNFGKKGYLSRHNLAYWNSISYEGFGPSAHSYNGDYRRWNISNLNHYIQAVKTDTTYWEEELLTPSNRYNEYILTRLRLYQGIQKSDLEMRFGSSSLQSIVTSIEPFLLTNDLLIEEESICLTPQGRLIADHITSSLMI